MSTTSSSKYKRNGSRPAAQTVEDTIMAESATESTAASSTPLSTVPSKVAPSTTTTDAAPKKPPGSGPIPITMDVYHQLQQKRLLERQQEQFNKPEKAKEHAPGSKEADTRPVHGNHRSEVQQPSTINALEQIVNIVQATAPAIPLVQSQALQQSQQVQMPGPDLANIIFGHTPSTSAAVAGHGHQMESESVHAPGSSRSSGAADGHTGGSNQSHYRKVVAAAPSSQLQQPQQPQQPRTTSPPTPISGPSSLGGAQNKNPNAKGPKAIHAIELIRIAGEILQFPPTTTGTALIYYHKYRAYLHQANKRGERDNEATKADEYLFATACLHLACKCTEVSRKVRDLVNVTYRVMNPNQPGLSLSTKVNENNGQASAPPLAVSAPVPTPAKDLLSGAGGQQPPQYTYPAAPPPTVATYWHIRDSLLTTELMLLRVLQFDLDVTLPFSDVLRIYKGMGMVFSPTDEEAAHLYPAASNFDVFLPAVISHHSSNTPSSAAPSSPSNNLNSNSNKHGTPSSASSSSSSAPAHSLVMQPHTGIHPTLSALVQISTTFCIDALCSSNIALNSSSRALAMGVIYLAIRSAGLELPLPFEEWCYAWGRPNIVTGFGIPVAGGVGGGAISGVSNSGMGAGVGAGGSGMNGLMGLSSSGTNSLFVSSPRPTTSASTSGGDGPGSGSYMEGLELSNGLGLSGGANGVGSNRDSIYSQTHSPLLYNSANTNSPMAPAGLEGSQDPSQQQPSQQQQQQPMTIVDEVRKVVQELGSFYTH